MQQLIGQDAAWRADEAAAVIRASPLDRQGWVGWMTSSCGAFGQLLACCGHHCVDHAGVVVAHVAGED